MPHPIWAVPHNTAIVVPTHDHSLQYGLFGEALDHYPGLGDIYAREVRYNNLRAGHPFYVTRGAIRDRTPFNAVHAVQGMKPNPPDIILFPVRTSSLVREMMVDIRSGMESMKGDQWGIATGDMTIAFPSLLESNYHPDGEAEKLLFYEILGDDPRFIWIGNGYE